MTTASPALRLPTGGQADIPTVPSERSTYAGHARPAFPSYVLARLVDALAQAPTGWVGFESLRIVGCDDTRITFEIDGSRFAIESASRQQQELTRESYGDVGCLWAYELTRVQWGGGIAGGNIAAVKDGCVSCDARAVLSRFAKVARCLIAEANGAKP